MKVEMPNGEIRDFTEEEIAEREARTTERNTTRYMTNRIKNYPSIGDQLDMIYHAGLGGDEFQAAIAAVKAQYPKPDLG